MSSTYTLEVAGLQHLIAGWHQRYTVHWTCAEVADWRERYIVKGTGKPVATVKPTVAREGRRGRTPR
jgi:hypothetical protein